jgi:hypothetical protein
MKSLANIPKNTLIAFAGVALLLVIVAIVALTDDAEVPSIINDQNRESQSAVRLTIDDIDSIFIHSGLDIDCPDLKGVVQNGYVYTVLLTGKGTAIERLGCGVGQPEVFAAAIAEDLETNGNFQTLPLDQVLEKMTFKFYDLQ